MLSFLAQLQAGSRLILVTGIEKSLEDDGTDNYRLAISGFVYVLRDPSAEAAADAADADTETAATEPAAG